MFGIDPRDYELKSELSTCCGGIATVYVAIYKPTTEMVAIKNYRMDKAKEETALIQDEILTMRQFNHPNILALHTAFVCFNEVHVVVPLMCYGSCRDIINRYFVTGVPEPIIAFVMRDVLHGIEYLHRKGFIHRAIRSSHILLNQHKAILGGFRDCTSFVVNGERVKSLHNLPEKSTKGLNWLAPEILAQNLLGYTEKADVYSVGITVCELANGIEPFADMSTTFMLTEKIRGNHPTLLDYSTCPTEDIVAQATDSGMSDSFAIQTRQIYSQRKLSDPFHKFTELCLQRLPHDRPTVTQMLGHTFFKQCKHSSLAEQLSASGVDAVDCTKTYDESIQLFGGFADMSIASANFEWDF